ncbi:hypothetical protein ACFX12_008106 [Malus domestica]
MVKSVPSRENEEQKNSRPETSLKPYQRTSFKKTRESSKGFEGFENDSVGFEIMFNLEEFLPELREGLEEEQPAPKVMDPIVEAAADDGIDKVLSDNIDFMADDIFSNVSFDGVDAATADSSSPSFEALMDNVIADYLTELFDNSNSNESPDGVENRDDVGELLEKYVVFPYSLFFLMHELFRDGRGNFLGGLCFKD